MASSLWHVARSPRDVLSSASHSHVTIAKLLSPFFSSLQQCRNASILSSLSDNRGAYNKRIRRGRGPASGKGKTSGRGHKGQKQHGKVPFGFNGGQTRDVVVSGVRGFINNNAADLNVLNVSRLAKWIASGRIDPRQPITIPVLVQSGCVAHAREGVKLLARQDATSTLKTPVHIIVNRASGSAIKAVESAGGQVITRYYSPSSVSRVMRGEAHPYYSLQSRPLQTSNASGLNNYQESEDGGVTTSEAAPATHTVAEQEKRNEMARFRYRLADATGRKDIEYYRDNAHRGYLSHTVEQGQNASLYFGGSTVRGAMGGKGEKKKKTSGIALSRNNVQKSDRLW